MIHRRLSTFVRFVKFEHTLFALPFAYAGTFLASDGWPDARTFLLVTLAMVGARTAAMAINRVVDAEIDARNPRTRDREIPVGTLTKRDGIALAVAGMAAFVVAGAALNPLTFTLLPVAAAFLTLYPYMKRWTWACHAWLGITIGAAAAGGWIAVTGTFDLPAILLWVAVAAWIGGFDVVYAMLDHDFDRSNGVHSVPARFGVRRATDVAAAGYVVAVAALVALVPASTLGAPFAWIVLGGVAPILAWQQIVLRRRGAAAALGAFNANLVVSVAVWAGMLADLGLSGRL